MVTMFTRACWTRILFIVGVGISSNRIRPSNALCDALTNETAFSNEVDSISRRELHILAISNLGDGQVRKNRFGPAGSVSVHGKWL
ncbi:hypothetical protein F4859DRAFT_482021 [Xylaria cf. heliscus]|nr:hypothetical protein F4859DRAFT_482021 [Xylaria cf. heliscus]